MPRLLHTADWQIGRAYTQWPPEAAVPLAEARLGAVERLARLASDQAMDLVLVAGDVFDAQTLSDRSLRRLFNVFEQKTELMRLLDVSSRAEGVRIYIGGESQVVPFEELSVVTAPYEIDGRIVGSTGLMAQREGVGAA